MKKVILLSLLALGSSEPRSSYGMHRPNDASQSDSTGTRLGDLRHQGIDSMPSGSPVMEDIIQRLTRAEARAAAAAELARQQAREAVEGKERINYPKPFPPIIEKPSQSPWISLDRRKWDEAAARLLAEGVQPPEKWFY